MFKKLFSYDKSLSSLDAGTGTITLRGLAIPIMIENLLRNMLSTVNTLILSNFSDTAASAIGTATQVTNIVDIIYSSISLGTFVVVSQNLGAGRKERAASAAGHAIALIVFLGIIAGAVLSSLAPVFMTMMNLTGTVLEEATAYFRIVSMFSALQGGVTLLSYICRSHGITKFNLYSAFSMNILNAILSYLVVFRVVELPLSGIEGVAYAKVISIAFALLLSIFMVTKAKINLGINKIFPINLGIIKDIMKVGIPSGMTSVSWCLSQAICSSMVASYGVTALNAKTYVDSVLGYTQAIGIGIGQAASIMSSRLVGAGEFDKAYRTVMQNHKLGLLGNFSVNTILALLGGVVIGMFTDDPEVLKLARTVLFIDIWVGIGKSFNLSLEDAIRGSGDSMYQMVMAMISCFAVTIVSCWLLGTVCGLGLIGCWIAYGLDEWFRGMAYLSRWHSRKWERSRLIHEEEDGSISA